MNSRPTVSSRSIDTPDGCALLPVWDYINHRRGAPLTSAATRFGGAGAGAGLEYRLLAASPRAVGDDGEVFHAYLDDDASSAVCAREWLLHFGFVPEHLAAAALRDAAAHDAGGAVAAESNAAAAVGILR